MESFDLNSVLILFVALGGLVYLTAKIFRKDTRLKTPKTIPSTASSTDFSPFESNDTDSSESDDMEIEEEEIILKGDMSKLEEFVDKLILLPKDTLSDIQISKSEDDDLLITIEKDETNGMMIEGYYPEEVTSLSYSDWLNATKQVIEGFQLKIESFNEKDQSIRIILEGKSSHEIKEITERLLTQGYLNKLGNSFLVEYFY
ncbi:MAG TPA: hypothetical protein PKC66_04775 [Leptospiraceae bacterium]|nr:hypothetical protein [Leptospiraceae bacterium]HMX31526.1 hypothetical protein [Leptospiraceae bacterium]HNB98419.1 hypothetical protein [Leptospiraceae bacterium]HNE09136.1 hypothetical protein [Leptospiraceae bacterium]HNH00198.1 hypothetical protein [Leptospiraceae bacterium]